MDNKFLQDCPPILKEYLFYRLTIKGQSPRTVQAYYVDLKTFYRFLICKYELKTDPLKMPDEEFKQIKIETANEDIITNVNLSVAYEFLNYTLSGRQNNASTRARKVSVLRGFYKYLSTKTTIIKENPLKDLEVPALKSSLPKFLSLEESLEFLQSINEKENPREHLIFTLLLNCGMRVSELVNINTTDVNGQTLRLLGKGNKERIIYLNDACLAAIGNWLKVKPQAKNADDKYALIVSSAGKRLSARRVQQITDDYMKLAGFEGRGISPHKLRHTAATLMYQHGGADVRVLKEILGHENMSTTEIYTHVANTQIESAMLHSPLAKVKKNIDKE